MMLYAKNDKKVRRKTNNSQVHRNSSIITTNYRKDFPSLERRGEGADSFTYFI